MGVDQHDFSFEVISVTGLPYGDKRDLSYSRRILHRGLKDCDLIYRFFEHGKVSCNVELQKVCRIRNIQIHLPGLAWLGSTKLLIWQTISVAFLFNCFTSSRSSLYKS